MPLSPASLKSTTVTLFSSSAPLLGAGVYTNAVFLVNAADYAGSTDPLGLVSIAAYPVTIVTLSPRVKFAQFDFAVTPPGGGFTAGATNAMDIETITGASTDNVIYPLAAAMTLPLKASGEWASDPNVLPDVATFQVLLRPIVTAQTITNSILYIRCLYL